ncbi:MAG TPA: MFS transporter [Jatrophihabitantaceae bacterium]|nr:MFS transporter [Jatrophihabitantaceae bacterium]
MIALGLVAFAYFATMVGGALPTPLYPAYEQRFGFGALTVTIVFAMYAVGVLGALLGVGRASDTIGRRPVLFLGLACAEISSIVFVVVGGVHSGGVALLCVARVFSGMSAGIFAGTATAAVADLAGADHRLRASVVAAIASIGGLGTGPLLAGLIAHYVDKPLQLTYAVHLVLVALGVIAISVVTEPVAVTSPRRWQFQRLLIPSEGRAKFLQAGTASFAGFALLGMFTSVCPAMLHLLGHSDPALTGIVVFAVFAASVAGQLGSTPLPAERVVILGTAGLIAGLLVVGLSLHESSLALLVIGGVVGGAAQGAGFRAALQLITAASPPDQRGAVASSFFAIGYIGLSIPVIGIGIGTREYGLVDTGQAFTGILAVLTVIALAGLVRSVRAESAA